MSISSSRAAACMAGMLLIGSVHAKVGLVEREHVQALVWAGEFVTFVVAVAIAVLVWRFSKRASRNRKKPPIDNKRPDA